MLRLYGQTMPIRRRRPGGAGDAATCTSPTLSEPGYGAAMRAQRMISVVGCHAEGEIGDVVVGGVLPPAGDTVFEMMKSMERDHDHIRRMLICEPRGSVARHVNVIVP